MSQELYYTAPSDKVFDEMKHLAIEIWKTYDDLHGYATEKINEIKDLPNVSDNFMYILAKFDYDNQATLKYQASKELIEEITKRL